MIEAMKCPTCGGQTPCVPCGALTWRRDGVPTEVGRVYALYHPSWGGTLITCKGDETPNTNGAMWLGPLPEPPNGD